MNTTAIAAMTMARSLISRFFVKISFKTFLKFFMERTLLFIALFSMLPDCLKKISGLGSQIGPIVLGKSIFQIGVAGITLADFAVLYD